MLFLLRLWIVAWVFAPTRTKNLPIVAATEPKAGVEDSSFDKAFAVVNAMFEQIARTPAPHSGRAHNWSHGDSHGNFAVNKGASSPIDASKEIPNSFYIQAKDSDFIIIDPLDNHDRNAAALSKMVQKSYQKHKVPQEEPPPPTSSSDSGEDHDVAATEDSKEENEHPYEKPEEGSQEEEHEQDEGDQGVPEAENEEAGDEHGDPSDHHSEAKERASREVDEDEEDEEDDDEGGAPLEGAPVTEEDLDDFAPETFMPPTVLGVARHYKVGSSFSVFPVHIPNAPEHVELGSGVPTESQEEEQGADDDDEEAPPKEAEDEEEGEDMEPHATTSSRHVVVEPAASEHDDAPVSSKKGHRVSEHGDDEIYWRGEGGDHEADEVDHDNHSEENDDDEEAEKLKKGSEKSKHYKHEGGAKMWGDLKEDYEEGKHKEDSDGHEDEVDDEFEKYKKKAKEEGYHDNYNFDKRTSRNRFYKNRRKKGDWIDSGEDEHIFYKNVEGDETGSYGKYNDSSGTSGSHGGEKGGHSTKEKEKWKKSKEKDKKEDASAEYEKGKKSKKGRGYYTWNN